MLSPAPLSDSSDVAVHVRAACQGDSAAFTELYGRFARMVHGILMARVPLHEVDDLVQDVFLRAWKQLHSLRDPSCFGGWLATVARNRANDFHRRSVEVEELDENQQPPSNSVRRASLPTDEGREILEIIKTLPDAYREPLILRLVEGMTGAEIAERIGITPGSVRVNLHRGMHMLREKLRGRSF